MVIQKLIYIFFTVSLLSSVINYSPVCFAGLSIKEEDPYVVFERDRKKDQKKTQELTRNDVSEARQQKKKEAKLEELPPSCDTAKEFRQTHGELISHQLLDFPDRDVVKIAYEVTKGCDGAAERFKTILNLLIASGVDKKKSVEFGLHFSKRSDEQTTAFVLIFKGTFLEKYYDLDFKTALATSFKLALEARGNPEVLARDFRSILDFCVEHKGTDLPFKICAPYALELSMHSYLYDTKGLADSFKSLMEFFSLQKEADYTIAIHLKFAGRILRHGPKAVKNFEEQYAYGVSDAMKLNQKIALELAVKVAENTIGRDLK